MVTYIHRQVQKSAIYIWVFIMWHLKGQSIKVICGNISNLYNVITSIVTEEVAIGPVCLTDGLCL